MTTALTSAPVARTSWGRILLVYLAGVLAAAALGKVGPVFGPLRSDVGLSLATAGWAASAITAVAAALGLVGGVWTDRMGGRRILLAGLILLAVTGAGGALAWNGTSLLVSRLLEGTGYLLVVVAAPALVIGLAAGADRVSALALWGTFVPVGLAAGSAAGGVVSAVVGWRLWFVGLGVSAAVVAALVATRVTPADAGRPTDQREPTDRSEPTRRAEPTVDPPPASRRPRRATLVRTLALSVGFGAVSMISVAVLTLLPTFLTDHIRLRPASAGLAVALVSLVSVPGGILAGWLMRHVPGLPVLGPLALAMPLLAVAMFPGAATGSRTVVAGAVMLLVNGVLVAVAFAAVPQVVDAPDQLGLGNGLLAQFGSCGSLLGPPLFAGAVDRYGWAAVPVLVGLAAVVGLVLFLIAHRAPARRA